MWWCIYVFKLMLSCQDWKTHICVCMHLCVYMHICVCMYLSVLHWKDSCWSWNSNTLAIWCKELTHWKRPRCWERLKAGGEGDDRRWDGWMASPTWWTWVWASSRSWWWTGKPGMLHSMGSQRAGRDWATELNWTLLCVCVCVCVSCSVVSYSLWSHRLWLARPLCPWNSLGKNTGAGSHSLLQGIFPTQRSNQVSHTAGRHMHMYLCVCIYINHVHRFFFFRK